MISLKRNIEKFDYLELWDAAMACYRRAVESIQTSAISVQPELLKGHKQRLQSLRDRLAASGLEPDILREHSQHLARELGGYRDDVEGFLKETASDVKEVLMVLAKTADKMSHRDNLYGERLSGISNSLAEIARTGDIGEVRRKLSQQVSDLRNCIEEMAKEGENSLQSLQRELVGFQNRLQRAQQEASTDPLTGIANRREGSKEIAVRVRDQQAFNILIFDLNDFKQVNDKHGHAAGDQVLKSFATRFRELAGPRDIVCRWGGDEFVIVFECPANELPARAVAVARGALAQITVQHRGVEQSVEVGADVGYAAYQSGDTFEQIFERADALLYRAKAARLQPSTLVEEAVDHVTDLPGRHAAEAAMRSAGGERGNWFAGCFVLRRAATVNNHYGYRASDELLPKLRDLLRASRFNGLLFRGAGASILAIVDCPDGLKPLEDDLRRIEAIQFEQFVRAKRGTSTLPVSVRAKVCEIDCRRSAAGILRDLQWFTGVHQGDDSAAPVPNRAV